METTILDVARAVGVSQTTVSRALSGTGRVSEQTRRAIIRAAVDLNYRHVRAEDRAAALPGQTIAVIVPDLGNPFLPEILKGITQAADAGGHLVVVSGSGRNRARGWSNLAGVRRKGVSGAVIVESTITGEQLQAATSGIPVVIFDRDYSLPGASMIRADQHGGAVQATEHLLHLGHTEIVHLRGPLDQPVATARAAGYEQRIVTAGLEPRVVNSDWSEQAGYESTLALLAEGRPFTAVFAASDPNAYGVLAALDEHHVVVPDDVSVVGFDDLQMSSFTHPRLTTIRQDGIRLGAAAAMILLRQWEQGRIVPVQETIPVDLIVRSSTAPPRKTPAGSVAGSAAEVG